MGINCRGEEEPYHLARLPHLVLLFEHFTVCGSCPRQILCLICLELFFWKGKDVINRQSAVMCELARWRSPPLLLMGLCSAGKNERPLGLRVGNEWPETPDVFVSSPGTLLNLLFKSLNKTIIWPSLPDFVSLFNERASTRVRNTRPSL